MKRSILIIISWHVCLLVAFSNNIDIPVSHLRAPAYPLVTIDPYISAWSHTDNLYDDDVRHWTGEKHPLIGAIRVDGKVYRFLGGENRFVVPLLNDAGTEKWEASYTTHAPSSALWYANGFDDIGWEKGAGAFGTSDMPNIGTEWNTKDIWIRRDFHWSEEAGKNKKLFLVYSHDDVFELYINGEQVVNTGLSWNNHVVVALNNQTIQSLKAGKNTIAAHCRNTRGGGYVDFGIFGEEETEYSFSTTAEQLSVNVLPTQTYYSFYCGPVQLDLTFTSPLVLNNLDLLGSPVNYVSYRVKSLDKNNHDVRIYFAATPQWAVNTMDQEVTVEAGEKQGMRFLKTGTVEQSVLGKSGDLIRIDWGYFYLASKEHTRSSMTFGKEEEIVKTFIESGTLPAGKKEKSVVNMNRTMEIMAYTDNLGPVGSREAEGHLLLAYDDIESIQYFGKNLKPYWKSKIADMETALASAEKNYRETMAKCAEWDKYVMDDTEHAGGRQYAELCALSYRQSVAAHKLVTGPEGQLFFFSKENNSNGSIGTVDVTYPSSPLFLRYNTEIAKAMLTFIFEYSESGRWTKPFPAHDVGTYPLANGQTYLEDMPVEEAGNMIIMTTAIAVIEKDASYARDHWETLTVWAEYLMKEGLDPENQLCTEDFAGHLAHNANLSAKAIMAIAGYGKLAAMLNKKEARKYTKAAREMAVRWEQMANDGDHYRLAFDRENTWSQKYNFVWNKVLGLNVLPRQIVSKEIAFYLKQQNRFGLPLDNRFSWSKIDDTVWTATMAESPADFMEFIIPLWRYAHLTPSRVPLGDWHETTDARYINFRARSVVGGVFMKSLNDYIQSVGNEELEAGN